jgi:hypothetical protein
VQVTSYYHGLGPRGFGSDRSVLYSAVPGAEESSVDRNPNIPSLESQKIVNVSVMALGKMCKSC